MLTRLPPRSRPSTIHLRGRQLGALSVARGEGSMPTLTGRFCAHTHDTSVAPAAVSHPVIVQMVRIAEYRGCEALVTVRFDPAGSAGRLLSVKQQRPDGATRLTRQHEVAGSVNRRGDER